MQLLPQTKAAMFQRGSRLSAMSKDWYVVHCGSRLSGLASDIVGDRKLVHLRVEAGQAWHESWGH